MRTEVKISPYKTETDVTNVDITVVLSEKNLRELQEDHEGLVNGVVKVGGRLLTPFAGGRIHVIVESDEIHYADTQREEAKQKIRNARHG